MLIFGAAAENAVFGMVEVVNSLVLVIRVWRRQTRNTIVAVSEDFNPHTIVFLVKSE